MLLLSSIADSDLSTAGIAQGQRSRAGIVRKLWFFGAAAVHFAGDIASLSNPILRKEFRVLLRSRRAYIFLFMLSVGISTYFLIIWNRSAVNVDLSTRSQISRTIFTSLYLVQICALGLISPVLTATVVTSERENKTLDLLFCTGITRLQIVMAKWFSAVAYQCVLMISVLPVIALTFQLGGVGGDEYLAAAIMIIATVCTGGMIGMVFSAQLRRTTTALIGAVITVLILGYLIPVYKLFDLPQGDAPTQAFASILSQPRFLTELIAIAVIFAVAMVFAWGGLIRRESFRPVLAQPIITDQKIIERRRKHWPFYLIDPMERAHEIRDQENPVYIKEQRVGSVLKLSGLIRLTYFGMLVSTLLVFLVQGEGIFQQMAGVALGAMTMLVLFVPVLSSTALSKEREENTLDLLRTTPLEAQRIVWGKYLVALRSIATFALSMMFLPGVVYSSFVFQGPSGDSMSEGVFAQLIAALKLTPFLLGFSGLYASLGLVCSSMCKRNVVAIVASYLVILACIGMPYFLEFVLNALPAGGGTPVQLLGSMLGLFQWFACPLLSPYFYFSGDATHRQHLFNDRENWAQILLHSALITGLTWALVRAAASRVHAEAK